jgi:tetratricopeptide (TPR) repeat protein
MEHAAYLTDEAWALTETQQYEAANAVFARLCELTPDNAEVWMMRGVTQIELGDTSGAKYFLTYALTIDPSYADPYLHLGRLALAEGDVDTATRLAEQAIQLDSTYVEAWLLAAASHGLGQRQEVAARCARHVLEFDPGNAQGLSLLSQSLRVVGASRLAQRQYDLAMAAYQELLQLNPADPDALNNLGNVYLARGEYGQAEGCYSKAIALSNTIAPEALSNLGQVFQSQGRITEAVDCYVRALEVNPGDGRLHLQLAMGLQAQGEFARAIEHCDIALQSQSGLNAALVGKADILQKQGKYRESYTLLLPLIKEDQPSFDAVLVFADACAHLQEDDRAVALVNDVLARTELNPRERQQALDQLGNLCDKRGLYDEAFASFRHSNEMKLKQGRFDLDKHEHYIDQLILTFNPNYFASADAASNMTDLPVFIVGMPRSGTSLVEQILASHAKVHGGGELDLVDRLSIGLGARIGVTTPYPQCMAYIGFKQIQELATEYYRHLRSLNGYAARITDKMPHNYLHLGLIQLLFPRARVIHISRDPLDTCLSCYFQNFSTSHSYAYDLEMLGKYYLQYEKLMRHWKRVLQLPVLHIQYEMLVNEQERVSRQMIEFCGLEWDEHVLRFFETKRDVATPSYDQVRQPMYQKSIQRWKNYESHLGSLIAVLQRGKIEEVAT